MKWEKFKQKTDNLLLIDKKTLRNLEKSENTLDCNIKYWLKKEKIVALRKGLYLIKDNWNKEENKDAYLEYIANQLILPSYVSMEYILSKYQLLTESSVSITSVTPKSGRNYANNLGAFNYYSISEKLFTGYKIKKFKDAPVYIASKEKALFDFLYFQFLQKEPSKKSIENLRINWENITKQEIEKSRRFCKLTKNKNIKKLFEILC